MVKKDEEQDLSAPRLAVEFAETVPTWRFREDFWHQKNGIKVQQEKEGILSSVYRFVASQFGVEEAKPGFVKQVVESLKQFAFVEGTESPPFWIGGVGPKDVLVGTNGLIDFSPLCEGGEVRSLPHDPQYFATGGCDYSYSPSAQCPEWLAFQQWQWGDDDEMRDFIEEWLAYCILQSMQLQTFLFVVGEGSNGKSVLASVFDAVLGRTNVSHVPIEDLGKQFSLYSTIGKLANVISDAEITDKLIESRLKSFTAGDPMRCDRKYRDALDALVATARVIAFGNAVPLFRDTSRAIMRRLRIAHAVVSVKGKPDRRLAQKLYAERAGILNRVIVAAKRLIARGEFAVPSACAKTEQDFWLSNDSARMWFTEHTCLSPGHFEPMEWLYTSYAMKMNKWGVEHPLWRGRLGRELNKYYADAIAAGDVQACRARGEWVASHPAGCKSGARPHGYLGIEVSMDPIGFDVDEEVPF